MLAGQKLPFWQIALLAMMLMIIDLILEEGYKE